MNVCIVIDQYPLPPRAIKMRDSLVKLNDNLKVQYFAWNRKGLAVSESDVTTYDDDIGYGNQLKKLIHLFHFAKALKHYLDNHPTDILHGIDFEMAYLCSRLKGDRKLIYEIYDIKFFSFKLFDNFRIFFEKRLMNHVNGIIYASPFFIDYYRENGFKEVFGVIVNNKPLKNSVHLLDNNFDKKNYITIGFIGVMRYKEILVNLIDALADLPGYRLLLAGSGPDEVYLRNYVSSLDFEDRIIINGRFELSQLSDLYGQTDIVWAAYPNKDTNVYYAISNKYYESIAFGKRVIVSQDTLLATWVSNQNLGYTVDPYDSSSIRKLLQSINQSNIHSLPNSDFAYWEDEEGRIKEVYGL